MSHRVADNLLIRKADGAGRTEDDQEVAGHGTLSDAAERLGLRHVLTFAALLLAVCAALTLVNGGLWRTVATNGDNGKYTQMATAIEKGDLRLASPTKYPWGLPFAVAVVARALRIGNVQALFVISMFCSLAATGLAFTLWGPWVALYFNAVDYTWLQFSAYGSSDSLFVLLTLASLLAARSKRYVAALLLAALGALVRTIGILLLPVVAIWALYEQGFRRSALAVALAGLVLGVYVCVMTVSLGDPLMTYHQYQKATWVRGLPVTWPLGAIVAGLRSGAYSSNAFVRLAKLPLVAAQVLVTLAIALIPAVRNRELRNGREADFALFYSIFLLIYNDPTAALSSHARYLLPVLPWLLWTVEPWLPKRWTVVGAIAAMSVLFAIVSEAGTGWVVHELSTKL